MKKIIAIALALVMTLALSVTCFAAAPADQNGDVKATYAAGATAGVVYSVNVTFGDMAFTYTDASEGTWDPETHTFKSIVAAKWTATGNTITVKNDSNAAVNVDITYAAATGYEGITGSIENNEFTLPTAVGKEVGAAELTKTATLTLDGALASNHEAGAKIGTVTVSFS